MQKKILLGAIFLAAQTMFPPLAFAAASAPVVVQTRQGAAAEEHAGHGESAGETVGKGNMARGGGRTMAWTAFPLLKTKAGGEGRDRRMVTVIPQNIVADSIDAYSNDTGDIKGHRRLPLEMAGARLDKPKVGGFHWLAAREERGDQVMVASTVQFFTERGAQNPTAMFMRQKHELEIIPQPFPREHSRYRANEDWKFLVHFNGKPLVNQKVLLETMNGTKAELISDAQGVITVRIPDDFREEEGRQKTAGGHDHERRSSDFVLATEHAEGGKTYLTAFNGSYGPDAFYQRSLAMGLGFTLLGMIGATPLLRQRKDKKKTADAGQSTDAPAASEATKNEDA